MNKRKRQRSDINGKHVLEQQQERQRMQKKAKPADPKEVLEKVRSSKFPLFHLPSFDFVFLTFMNCSVHLHDLL